MSSQRAAAATVKDFLTVQAAAKLAGNSVIKESLTTARALVTAAIWRPASGPIDGASPSRQRQLLDRMCQIKWVSLAFDSVILTICSRMATVPS